MRRLEAEALRDTLLSVAGTLGKQMFGASQAVVRQKDGEVVVPGQKQNRRSIYVKIQRLNPETMLEVFDQPTMTVNCTQRSTSTVSTQALTLLNSDTMARASTAFAKRALAEQPDDPVRRTVLIAFARQATAAEHEDLATFVSELTTHYLNEQKPLDREKADVIRAARVKAFADLCQMLMSANEFIYVD
jgi:hypothetical protein